MGLTSCDRGQCSLVRAMESEVLGGVTVERAWLGDDGTFPNNATYPLLVYRQCCRESEDAGSKLLTRNGWTSPWAWGIFEFHHYHCVWEALLCVRGSAEVRFGGPCGPLISVHRGDCVLVPPGVAHKQETTESDFLLLGAYPDHNGCRTPDADTIRGAPTPAQAAAIRACPTPTRCPIYGEAAPWSGGLARLLSPRRPPGRAGATLRSRARPAARAASTRSRTLPAPHRTHGLDTGLLPED